MRVKMNERFLSLLIERSKVARYIYLIRKAFFSKYRYKHYSQFGEDISIKMHCPDIKNGFFVDVGCYHPKKFNNTYALYEKGWSGINIDVDEIKIDTFNLARKRDINILCAVSDKPGVFKWFSNGLYSLTATLDETFAKSIGGYTEKEVKVDTLTSIIDKTRYVGREIDFLSIDAEGHDFNVLKSLDFEQYKPKLIAVESHLSNFREIEKGQLYKFLSDKGFVLVNWCGFTLIFKKCVNST